MQEGNTVIHEVTPSSVSFYLCKLKFTYFDSAQDSHKHVPIALQDERQQGFILLH